MADKNNLRCNKFHDRHVRTEIQKKILLIATLSQLALVSQTRNPVQKATLYFTASSC